MSYQRWRPCQMCREPAQEAVCGNLLLSRWDVWRLPREQVPAISWRCAAHRRYKMRPARRVSANEYGDRCLTLVCGHQVQGVCRGEWGDTPALVERGLAPGELRLDRRQRCSLCGNLERESGAEHATGH